MNKNKKENIYLTIFGICLIISIIIEFILFFDMNSLLADVNNTVSQEELNLYQKYTPGDIIYFDPVSDEDCNEQTFDINKINLGQSTCYKWRVISVNDSSVKSKINIQLDHNIVQTDWISSEELSNYSGRTANSIGPKTALSTLANVTSTWKNVDKLNYSYDSNNTGTTNGQYHYGMLNCVDGTCTNGRGEVLAQNLKARIITGEEVKAIATELTPNLTPLYDSERSILSWEKNSDATGVNADRYYFSSTNSLNDTQLSWLVENLGSSLDSGSTYACNTYPYASMFYDECYAPHGYFTLSPMVEFNASSWYVYDEGYLYNYNTGLTGNIIRSGVRPVVEYNKPRINYLITYNDEERITERLIPVGSKAENIASQGKEKYTFLYWSKKRNGQEYDFNSDVTSDLTLYAVYNKNGCSVVDNTTAVDYIEDLYLENPETSDLGYDATSDKNLRFINRYPNNYISFNNELWRIIGIFNTENEFGETSKRLKIVRDDPLTGISFDSTPYVTGGTAVNSGMGINDYSQSAIMKVLNPNYENNSAEIFTNEGGTYVSQGNKKVNNSLYWNKESGLCVSSAYNLTMNCDFSQNGLSEEAQNYIDNVVWNLGAIPYSANTSAVDMYYAERSNKTTKSEAYATAGIDDDLTRNITWIGKVGLPYISDYILATGDFYSNGTLIYTRNQCATASNTSYGACTSTSDWFSIGSQLASISSVYGKSNDNQDPLLSSVAILSTVYGGATPASYLNTNIRPTVYLKTNTQITGGDGSHDNPYTISFVQEQECVVNVTFNDDGRLTEETLPVGSKTQSIESQGKNGYTFKFWSEDKTNAFDFNTQLEDDIVLYAVYEPINYTITYKGLTDEEKTSLNNPTSYTVESEDITINNPNNKYDQDGDMTKRFVGWTTLESATPSQTITITQGSTGNIELTANFEDVAPDVYTIIYNLNGGQVDGTNPSSFTKLTQTFTLINPTKEGYDFTGWTGSNGETPQTTVTINQGTKGDKNYEANYTPTEYTITINYNEGTLEEGKTNPSSYTIESENILLNNPVKEGYDFTGWTGSNGETPQTEVTINQGSTGNKNYDANYIIKKYDVEFYNLDEKIETLQVEHNSKIDPTLIPIVKREGYELKGWKLEDSEELFDLDTNITKNYKLYAVFEKIKEDEKVCNLKITSGMYDIDNDNFVIKNVPENASNETILSYLNINADSYEITKDYVRIKCDGKELEYQIKRIWIPQTGQVIIKYIKVIAMLSIIIVLLIVINKQRLINKRLRR